MTSGGGSAGTVDQSLDGSKSKSGSVRSGGADSTGMGVANRITSPSSAIHNSQGQLSRLTSAGGGSSSKSKKSSTHSVKSKEQDVEDCALYDSIEAINTAGGADDANPAGSSNLLGRGDIKHGRDVRPFSYTFLTSHYLEFRKLTTEF